MRKVNLVRLSENTFLILFEQIIDADNFSRIKTLVRKIKQTMANSLVDVIPSYASIHITFNLLAISGIECKQRLEKLLLSTDSDGGNVQSTDVIEIPVYYGSEVALDLPYLAEKARLSEREVIAIHSNKIYDVYAIGFAPGFAYLGNVDKRIATARKETPRKKVASGSVGIADEQTAIYPSESPGGWQIIGRTPIQLIDYQRENLSALAAGDRVKFIAIDQDEYSRLGGVFPSETDANSNSVYNSKGDV
jgi:inhibitor of KinA